jgi:hypothetical protein
MTDAAAIAAFVSAGVALAVGLVNPFLSNRRADERLRAQLDHERWMKTREERVELIYGVAQALTSAQRATDEVVGLWKVGVPWADERRLAASATQWDRVEELRQARARLAISYSHTTPIFRLFDAAQMAQIEYRQMLDQYERGQRLPEVRHDALRSKAVAARRKWLDEARAVLDADRRD